MGLIDYLLEKTLKVSPDQLYRHECAECDALVGDRLPSLPPDTPVFCHFTLNIAEHSGICIGDRIVHLDGSGEIISSTPQEFLARLDGSNLATNIYIYVWLDSGCYGNSIGKGYYYVRRHDPRTWHSTAYDTPCLIVKKSKLRPDQIEFMERKCIETSDRLLQN